MIGCLLCRGSWSGGRPGDVWVLHDFTGDGGGVNQPDEGGPGNTETLW